VDRPLRLDVDLAESEPGRFRNASELDEYFLWMETTFGVDVASRLKAVKAEVTEYVEEAEGLTLLKNTESASKAEIAAAKKKCKRVLKSLLYHDEWKERHALIDLIRGFRESGGQSDWMDYNAFLHALKAYARSYDIRLMAGRIKAIRAWVAQTNPKAEKVIDKVQPADVAPDERFGIFPLNDQLVTFERDADLSDTERVPLERSIVDYFEEEVLRHVPDAWINPVKRDTHDGNVGIVGYEISFNRYYYKFTPPRPLEVIDSELKAVEAQIASLLAEVAE